MLLIRPLLAANQGRRRDHIVIFLIFLVGNIGGGLTPLGNSPVFLAFLEGVDFFWTVRHLGPPILLANTMGAVFIGACTNIGNAPNLLVKAIAEERGAAMPGFFGYMAWAAAVLLPLFGLMTLIWF